MTAAATIPARIPGTMARSMASPRDTLRTSAISVPRRLAPGLLAFLATAQASREGRSKRAPAHRPLAPGPPVKFPRLLLAEHAVGQVVLVADDLANRVLGEEEAREFHRRARRQRAVRRRTLRAALPGSLGRGKESEETRR